MKILITTFGRPYNQVTLKSIPNATLVIQQRETHQYSHYHQQELIALPKEIEQLSDTRQWILENFSGHVCLLDDDLTFATRRTDNPTLFYPSSKESISQMLRVIDASLDKYAHVGIAAREGANRNTEKHRFNTRVMRLLAYDMDVLRKLGVRFNRLTCMSDFDMTLQLLRAGYPNILLNRWCQNQYGSNATGGCSAYRTPKVLAESAEGLKRLHPDFVTVVEKTTKGAWGGGTRKDVRIQWKKALAASD